MTRRFRHYPGPTITAAINAVRASTGWPEDMSVHDMAAHILAGHGADDAAIADAARQVAEWQAGV